MLIDKICTLDELPKVGREILSKLPANGMIALCGEMGAGKTTLVSALVGILSPDVAIRVTSPTFSIMNEYSTNPISIRHLDLYRLRDESELFDLDIAAALETKSGLVFVEWADKFKSVLSRCDYTINLVSTQDGQARNLKLMSHP